MAEPGLSEEEIEALAAAFEPGPASNVVLRRAGFPRESAPAIHGLNRRQYWSSISDALEVGVLEDGRHKIMVAALRDYPHNPIFQQAAQSSWPRTGPAARRVLVIGASVIDPAAPNASQGLSMIRADRETKSILQAAELGHMTVDTRPAATVDDLDSLRAVRPDILHLICHGDGENLVFADAYGEPHRIQAAQVARLLETYQQYGQVRLAGLVLNACYSGAFADLFTSVADTVIAHQGKLDDSCAQVFSGQLYRTLRDTPSVGAAAVIAARRIAADESGCGEIEDGLVVRPPFKPNDGH